MTEALATAPLAPVALFVYSRPLHTRRTIEALQANVHAGNTDLFIFSDGPKHAGNAADVAAVREYIGGIRGFRSVTIEARPTNAGLATSIIEGVTRVCGEHGRVIVLEDDLVTSSWFLQFMNQALNLYQDDDAVASVHGYCYPVRGAMPETFFLRGADCWGWATWSRAWRNFEPDGGKLLQMLVEQRLEREFDLDGAYSFTDMLRAQIAGHNNSWAVRWYASCFLGGKLTLYPGRTLVQNIGNDGSGTHCAATEEFAARLATQPIVVERMSLAPSEAVRFAIAEFLRDTKKGGLRRVVARATRRLRTLARPQ